MCTYTKGRQRSLIAHLAGVGVAVSPPAETASPSLLVLLDFGNSSVVIDQRLPQRPSHFAH